MQKLLVLYMEMAGYFIACLNTLKDKHNVEIHVVRYDINQEAPFEFNTDGIVFYSRDEYTDNQLLDLAHKIEPSMVYCGGWVDKGYLKVAQAFKGKVATTLVFDNKWQNTLKQNLYLLAGKSYIRNKFSHCWVPGQQQKQFAQKLGFSDNEISLGMYCADVNLFQGYFKEVRSSKKADFPKRLLYVGRYVRHKGIYDLWEAFLEIEEEMSSDWELWCLGTGELFDQRINHPKIRHEGFVQPGHMMKYIRETGVFVLPSHFEPWGVAAHEFAAAGFPMICSDQVGAAEAFLEDGGNGYLYSGGNKGELKRVLRKIMSQTDEELVGMMEKSVELALRNTPEKWAQTLMKIMNS